MKPCLFFLAAASALAQTPALTLDDCIRMAQAAQSAVSIARQQVEIAHYGVVQSRAGFLPQTGVNNGFTYNSPTPANRQEFAFVALNGIREYAALGTANLDIDTSGRLRAQLARARADVDVANANLVLTQRDLRRAVTAAYYRVLLARHIVDSARASLAEARSFEQRTNLLVQGQEAARADLVKAQAESQFLQQALNGAELEARLANHDLASFWTAQVDQELNLEDAIAQPPPAPESIANAMANRIEFRIYDAQRRGFLADARRARADLLPQLGLTLQYGIDANRVSWQDRGYAAFINLHIPVFDWFRARSAQRQFQLQAAQVDTQGQIAQRLFSRDYQDAKARVDSIYGQIAVTEAQVKLAEENLRLARIRYEGGEGSALDVVTAQSQLAQARTNLYTARAGYLNARAELEVAAGR